MSRATLIIWVEELPPMVKFVFVALALIVGIVTGMHSLHRAPFLNNSSAKTGLIIS